jgi:hypothetical protein
MYSFMYSFRLNDPLGALGFGGDEAPDSFFTAGWAVDGDFREGTWAEVCGGFFAAIFTDEGTAVFGHIRSQWCLPHVLQKGGSIELV